MTLSTQRLEKACRALIDADPTMSGYHASHIEAKMKYARAAISAYLGDTHVDVPREPTNETLDAIVEECMAAWGVNSGGKEKPRPIMWKSEWRERARPFYRAMLSAELTERDAG